MAARHAVQRLIPLLVLPLAFLTAGSLRAQDTGDTFMVWAGASRLANSDARDATSSSGFHGGLGFLLPEGLVPNSKPSIDLDYSGASGQGNRISSFGLTYTERAFMSENKGNGAYLGLGLGVFRNSLSAAGFSDNNNRLGAKAMVGIAYKHVFGELSYQLSGSIDDVKTNTLNLALGVRF